MGGNDHDVGYLSAEAPDPAPALVPVPSLVHALDRGPALAGAPVHGHPAAEQGVMAVRLVEGYTVRLVVASSSL